MMKAVLVLSLALIISGCATTTKRSPNGERDKLTQLQLQALRQVPYAAADQIPVLLIGGANNKVEFSGKSTQWARLVEKDQLAKVSADYAKFAVPIVIAVDASRVREQKFLTAPSVKEVTTQVSVTLRPNPDYQAAQQAVRNAENELRAAEAEEKGSQQQAMPAPGSPNAAAWEGGSNGPIVVSSTAGLRWAKEYYQNTVEILNVTKQTIEEPVFKTTKVPTASYVVNTSGAIVAYVIDVAAGVARMVRLPVDQESNTEYAYNDAKGRNVFESVSPPAHPLELSIEDILKRSEGAPTVALTKLADHVAAGRKSFADETAVLDKQRADMTASTLLQLDSLAANAQAAAAATTPSASGGETR